MNPALFNEEVTLIVYRESSVWAGKHRDGVSFPSN